MTGKEAVRYINSYHWSSGTPGLERIRALMKRLGDPQKGLRFIHVAGSNGKGSTCAMLASILQRAGYRTGLFTSPHLEHFTERFRVDGEQMSEEELGRLTDLVRVQADAMEDHPGQFEMMTAIGLLFFAERECAYVVLETGMGGEFDSTNVIDAPEAAVITRIGLEHTEYLGDTLEKIAATKAGIIKEGCDVICYEQEPEVTEVIRARAEQVHAGFHLSRFDRVSGVGRSLSGQTFIRKTEGEPAGQAAPYKLSLPGSHQLHNAAVVLDVVDVLRARGASVSEEAVREGLEKTVWPARFEVLRSWPPFILDGAHNPQCAECLAENLRAYLPGKRFTFLVGVLADKDYRSMLDSVKPLAERFLCVTPESGRALDAEALAEELRAEGCRASAFATVGEALETVWRDCDGPAAAFGSLYFAGTLRREWAALAQSGGEDSFRSADAADAETPVQRVSVRSMVEFICRSGDIDDRFGSGTDVELMQEGGRLHRKIQGRMQGDYRAEVPLSFETGCGSFLLQVEGRADGVFTDTDQESGKELLWIDEIKCIRRSIHALREPIPVQLAQAKCYAWILAADRGLSEIGVQMTYCQFDTEEIRRFREVFRFDDLTGWFGQVLSQYERWASFRVTWQKTMKESARSLTFPYEWREGQKQTAAAVYRSIERRKTLFIQAPTGTGKTLAAVFPAVKAVGEGLAERLFYMTAKTITRQVAQDTFDLLSQRGLRMKVLTLTAKEKICFCEETLCNPVSCPYAEGHFDRVNEAMFEMLQQADAFDREAVAAQAQKWKVCPFELSLDLSLFSDAVICDYNYVFDPRAKLKRFFADKGKKDYVFLADEAHNMVDRGREMFSASIYKEEFLELKKETKGISAAMTRALGRCNKALLEEKRVEMEPSGVRVWPSIGLLPVHLMNLCGTMEEWMEQVRTGEAPPVAQDLNRRILEVYFHARTFLDVCDCLDENYLIYSRLCEDGRFLVRLLCVDISGKLQECMDQVRCTVYFSATLLPVQYYKSLLSAREDDYAVYAHSTFPSENRQILIGGDVTSRYADRSPALYARIAEHIRFLTQARPGNYMVFFPSYRMLQDTAAFLEDGDGFRILCQTPQMTEEDRESFLSSFEAGQEQTLVGLCVMGGIFGEGIDLKEDRLIGAVIVGTGIPQIGSERELLKRFYDARGEDGFFYAYLCPGMNRVLQSAGRVIRTENDRGVILLLDERFNSYRYRSMFPAEWTRIERCTVKNTRALAEAFWNEAGSETEKGSHQ